MSYEIISTVKMKCKPHRKQQKLCVDFVSLNRLAINVTKRGAHLEELILNALGSINWQRKNVEGGKHPTQ